jgi:hypothetical protein
LLQKPITRPGLPSRLRPTSAVHPEQNRLPSGTSGNSMTAVTGSTGGISGSSTSGVPLLLREDVRITPTVRSEVAWLGELPWPVVPVVPVVPLVPVFPLAPVVAGFPRSEVPVVPGLKVAAGRPATLPQTVQ